MNAKRITRILALALALALGALGPAGRAVADIEFQVDITGPYQIDDGLFTIDGTGVFTPIEGSGDYTMWLDKTPIEYKEISGLGKCNSGFVYSHEMLMGNSGEFSSDLAKASAVLSDIAYGTDEGNSSTDDIYEALRQMGYGSYSDYGSYNRVNNLTVWDNDHIGFVIAKQQYRNYTLYCIPVKGTSGNAEWNSDFRLGDVYQYDRFHEGFYKASQDLMSALQQSFAQDTGERILWFTGHSRGAAVANLVAGLLTETERYATADHIFCYTYACPSVGLSSRVSAYENIINFNNAGDLIPTLPLRQWKFGRFGVTHTQNLNACPNFLRRFRQERFKSYTGASEPGIWETPLYSICPTYADYPQPLLELLAWGLGGRNDFSLGELLKYEWQTYKLDYVKLGLSAAADIYDMSGLLNVLNANVDMERRMLEDIDGFYGEYRGASGEDRQGVLDSYSYMFSELGDWLGIQVSGYNDVGRAKEQLSQWLTAQQDLLKDLGQFIGLIFEPDCSPKDMVYDGHEPMSYILWMNSWYCGYKGWQGAELESLPGPSECRLSQCATIGQSAFEDCYSLKTLALPSQIAHLGKSCFWNCPDIQSITMPVELAGDDNVFTCDRLETLHFTVGRNGIMPDDAIAVGAVLFTAGSSLKTLELDEGIIRIGKDAFSSNHLKTLVGGKLPSSLTSIGPYAFRETFQEGSDVTSLEIPPLVTQIPEGCFKDCTALTSLTVPKWVTSLGDYAFDGMTNLKTVTIPIELSRGSLFSYNQVESIHYTVQGDGVMPDRNSLESTLENGAMNTLRTVVFDEGVTHIGSDAFILCDRLKLAEDNLPSTLVSIGANAFGSCKSLTHAVIPMGVMEIGQGAFGWSGLIGIVFKGYAPKIGEDAFIGCTVTAHYNPLAGGWTASVRQDYRGKVTWVPDAGGALNVLTLPASLGQVSDRAFTGNAAQIVLLPNGVTSIGAEAFAGCPELRVIYVPASVTQIAEDAFSGSAPVVVSPSGSYALEYARRKGLRYRED